ncbi:hypothetical protein NDU88_008397 [Pleurodeles waltl]|uniref:Uncharacterized protein n=1 Tax=Pleurodeles waltl TaxID=8319 RepID=A0AAV7QSQ0_PLEWA|nr:hypothetical protein NDU88_008397 [Pleurodeles waltl]
MILVTLRNSYQQHTVSGCLLPPSRAQHGVTFGDESGPTSTDSGATHRTPSDNTGLSDPVREGSPAGLPAEPSRTTSTHAHASRPQCRPTILTSDAARVCPAGTAETSIKRPYREKLPRPRRAVPANTQRPHREKLPTPGGLCARVN